MIICQLIVHLLVILQNKTWYRIRKNPLLTPLQVQLSVNLHRFILLDPEMHPAKPTAFNTVVPRTTRRRSQRLQCFMLSNITVVSAGRQSVCRARMRNVRCVEIIGKLSDISCECWLYWLGDSVGSFDYKNLGPCHKADRSPCK